MADNQNNNSSSGDSGFAGLVEGFKNLILERFSSPFVFSFLASWLIVNFKLISIILSNTNIAEKLILIDWYFNNG